MKLNEDNDDGKLDRAAKELGEVFHSVLILGSRTYGPNVTLEGIKESGNTFANYGLAKQYVLQFEARMRDAAFSDDDDDE